MLTEGKEKGKIQIIYHPLHSTTLASLLLACILQSLSYEVIHKTRASTAMIECHHDYRVGHERHDKHVCAHVPCRRDVTDCQATCMNQEKLVNVAVCKFFLVIITVYKPAGALLCKVGEIGWK